MYNQMLGNRRITAKKLFIIVEFRPMPSPIIIRPRPVLIELIIAITLAWACIMQSRAVEPVSGPSLIPNGDFETANHDDHWPDGWPKAGVIKEEAGNHFLRLTSDSPGKMVTLYRSILLPIGTKALRLSWRWRVSGLKVGKQPWFDARLMLEFKDSAGAKVKPAPAAPYLRKDTPGWVQGELKFLVPESATTLEFMPSLLQVDQGTLDLDDIELHSIDAQDLLAQAAAKETANQAKLAKLAAQKQAKAAAHVQPDGSLISNGGFELSGKSGSWPDDWGKLKEGGSWELENGNHFLRLKSTTPGATILMYRAIDLPAGLEALRLSWRERVSELKKGKLPWNDARIMLEFKDAAGQTLANKPSPPYTQNDTKGWVARTTDFLVPQGAITLVLMPSLFQVEHGVFDLDDISLKPTSADALREQARLAEEAAQRAYVAPETPDQKKWPQELHVSGNRILNKSGAEVWLQGVNAGGLETLVADRQIMKSAVVGVDDWKANIIRLPVKGDYWFGDSPLQKDGGKSYRETIDQIITLVANRGAYLLLDLHRFRAPTEKDVAFWKDAASRYKNHPAVLFDLFNEPHDVPWDVWKNGGWVSEKKQGVDESAFLDENEKKKANAGFPSVGMQALVNAARQTGARNIVVVGGLAWSGDLSGVAQGYALDDAGGDGIVYSWHNYNWHKDWQGRVLAAAAKYPILVGEVGADEKKMDFIPLQDQEDPYTWVPDMLGFIQKYHLHWTAWCLHPKATPVLISDWNYTPTPYWGAFAKRALAGEQFTMKKMR